MSSSDLMFAQYFAEQAGHYIAGQRESASASRKTDGTLVTEVDLHVNEWFIGEVRFYEGNARSSVIGEEMSGGAKNAKRAWIIDPVDGTKEYANPEIPDHERTSCVAIALREDGIITTAAVYNPFRDELFLASRSMGTVKLNGKKLPPLTHAGFSDALPYDSCHWKGAPIDTSVVPKFMKRPPIGAASATWRACDVARGKSSFVASAGSKLHDVAAASLIVEMAGGVVSDAQGGDILGPQDCGSIFAANAAIHREVVQLLVR